MTRRIELEAEGVTVVARLLDDKAPATADRFWEALPIDQKLRHLRWGGSAAYVLESRVKDHDLAIENPVAFYPPGTIGFRPEHGEIAISYGQAQVRGTQGNAFATYLADLEGDCSQFLDVMMRTQREGAKRLQIRRKEG